MMVTGASDIDMNILDILSMLESKTASTADRIEAYTHFSNHIKEDDLNLFNLDVAKHADRVWSVIRRDVMSDQVTVAQGALQVLGFFLHDTDNIRSLSSANVANVISVLNDCVLQTEDKTTCTRALWCLSLQNLPSDVVSKNLVQMLKSAELAMERWKSLSITAENEASNVISRLLEVCPKEMKDHVTQWGKMLLPLLVHGAVKIREKTLEVVNAQFSTLMTQQVELSQFMVTDFSKKFAGELRKLFGTRNEMHVLKTWGILVQILGNELHRGSFINHVLQIAELGFKSSNAEVKCMAFQAWQQLIDNFATSNSILTDPKRIKLVMQVFKLNNAKVESVAMVKLQVWWHFIWLLGPKASVHFDQVCVPLLHFCLGGGKLGVSGAATPRGMKTGTSPATPQMNLGALGTSSVPPVIPALQLKGCEVLAHILGSMPDDIGFPVPSFSMDPLSHDIVTGPSIFYKHANLLIHCTTELICSLGNNIPEGLLYQIWYSLIAHMKNALEHLRLEMREILTSFLTQFQVIILSQALSHKHMLKMMEVVCCLPRKSLTSTAYNISNGEKIHGTPALFLTELLLTPVLLTGGAVTESYMVLFGVLIECGFSTSSGTLEFCQSVIRLLKENAAFVESPEMTWRLWSSIVNPLHEHIRKSNEVNQGDALEHNFSCLYTVLMFPLQQGLPTKMPLASVKTMLKTWCDVYKTFARLSALVTNAEANICCEELCQKLLKTTSKENLEDMGYLDFVAQCCQVIVGAVDFSSLGAVPTFNLNGLSPAKWAKRKQKPMDNLQSLVVLTRHLSDAIVSMATDGDSGKKSVSGVSLQNVGGVVVDMFTQLFTHVTSPSILSSMIDQLAQPIGDLLHGSANKMTTKMYSNAFQQKLEKLWQVITTTIQQRFTTQVDSDFLAKLSPLLEATFLHPRRAIKNLTTNFWKSAFSQSSALEYPETLKPVLFRVKEKTSIVLPGWSTFSIPVVEETPVSQMSQAESQAPEPRLPGMPSPVKIRGSFLNKVVSPNIKKSPAKPVTMETKTCEVVKRDLLAVNGMKNDDYVVIKSPAKKKRVLTEHQKEVFREKKAFPAMYNSLDVSQDVSLMASQFSNENTQAGTPSPVTDSVIIIGSSSSQSQPNKNTSVDAKDKAEVTESTNSGSRTMKEPKKPKRRRSVRFHDSGKQDEVDSVRSSIDDIESHSIEHFSVIQQAIGQDIDANKTEKTIEDESSQNKKGNGSSETSASNLSLGDQVHGSRSSGESSFMSSIPQNPLGAIGIFDIFGIKSLSQESKKSEKSSSLEKAGNIIESEADAPESEINFSQPLLNWTNKLTALSQSPRIPSSSEKNLSPRKSLSPALSQSSPKSSQEKSNPFSRKSPRKVNLLDAPGQCNLDQWLGHSSRSKGGVSDKQDDTPASLSAVVTVVEETQSPTKRVGDDEHDVREGTLPTILETPPRPLRASVTKGSHKKLFDGDTGGKITEPVDDCDIIPASPPSIRSNFRGKIGTPVLKLKRLTDEQIKQFSPTRRDVSQDSPAQGDGGQDSPTVSQQHECTTSNTIASQIACEKHEHDDFSEIRPLDSEEIIPSSQGFVTASPSKSDSCVLMKTIGNDEKNHTDVKNGDHISESIDIQISEGAIDQDKQKLKTDGNLVSQILFTEQMSDEDIDLYDPGLDSTFKDAGAVTPKLLDTKNLTDTNDNEEDLSQIESSESQQENSAKGDNEEKTFDPKEACTMACEEETPRRGRKRKQRSPKWMSPDSMKPKRIRKTPKKYSPGDESGSGTITPAKSQKEASVTETPKTGTSRSGLRTKRLSQTTPSGTQKNNGPISVVVDVHVSTEEKQEIHEEIFSFHDENMNNSEKMTSNLEQSSEKTLKGIGEKELLGVIADEDKIDSIIELAEDIGEKTPEGRGSQSTPHRKSTAKTKKEAALKRARHAEKNVMINSGITNLDSDSSEEDLPNVKTSQNSTSDLTKYPSEAAPKFSQALTSESKKDLCVAESAPQESNAGVTVSDISAEEASMKPSEKGDDEQQEVVGVHVAMETEEKCDINAKSLSVEKPKIPTLEKSDEEDDIPLAFLSNQDEKCDKSLSDFDEEDNVPLNRIQLNKGILFDERVEENKDDDKEMDVIDLTESQSQKIGKSDVTESQSQKKSKSDLTESQSQKKGKKKSIDKKSIVTTRLRSSGKHVVVRTRSKGLVRTGNKDAKANKPLRLKKTAKKKSNEQTEVIGDENSNGNTMASLVQEDGDAETPDPLLENKTQEVEKGYNSELDKEKTSAENLNECVTNNPSEIVQCDKDNIKNDNLESDLAEKDHDLDETPRKIPDKFFVPNACTLFESQSDSKLMSASRKFDKNRRTLARRSILKQPSPSQDSDQHSPGTRRRFHPIRVGHIYSPSASPSAGILKKRRLSCDVAVNSPSPPNKQRRVCFAHPLTVEQEAEKQTNQEADNIKAAESMRPHSPLVTSTRVLSSLEKFFTVPGSPSLISVLRPVLPSSPSTKPVNKAPLFTPCQKQHCIVNMKESQLTPTQSSYKSTQESQLNTTDPIYPELLECADKVDKILPQLTTSMWMRGLGQLVRARNIHTIGDLSALTEREVDNLPIKSPKISIVRSVLKRFEDQKEAKKARSFRLDMSSTTAKGRDDVGVTVAEKVHIEPATDGDLQNPCPVDKLSCEKDVKNQLLNLDIGELKKNEKFTVDTDSVTSDGQNKTTLLTHTDNITADENPRASADKDEVESITVTSADKDQVESETVTCVNKDDVESLTDPISLQNRLASADVANPSCSSAAPLLNTLEDIVRQCNDTKRMTGMKTDEIFQIQHHLTNLSATVMSVLKGRCRSPDPPGS